MLKLKKLYCLEPWRVPSAQTVKSWLMHCWWLALMQLGAFQQDKLEQRPCIGHLQSARGAWCNCWCPMEPVLCSLDLLVLLLFRILVIELISSIPFLRTRSLWSDQRYLWISFLQSKWRAVWMHTPFLQGSEGSLSNQSQGSDGTTWDQDLQHLGMSQGKASFGWSISRGTNPFIARNIVVGCTSIEYQLLSMS